MCAAVNSLRHSAYRVEDFQTVRSLGKGSFGTVNEVVHKQSGNAYAMKVVEKKLLVERGLQEQFKREVVTQLKVSHMNVVRMLYYFEDKDTVSCLLEYADQGQLFAYLKKQAGGLPEPRAATFFVDTTRGVQYLHSFNVIHRDIKPENILLFTDALTCKIADLGWCVELTPDRPERLTFCGTMDYLPPEMLYDEPHDFSLDMWALGILLFEMLVARPPFVGTSPKFVADQICNGELQIPVCSMSDGPAEIIQGLLVRDKTRRWSIERVLSHPWTLAHGGSMDSIAMEVTVPAARPPPVESKLDEVTVLAARPPPVESKLDEVTVPAARPPPVESKLDFTLAAADLEITRPAGWNANGQRINLQEQSPAQEANEQPETGAPKLATVDANLLSKIRGQMDDMNKSFQAKFSAQQDKQIDKTIERSQIDKTIERSRIDKTIERSLCQSSTPDPLRRTQKSKCATIDESQRSVHVSDSSDEDTRRSPPPEGDGTWPLRRRRPSGSSPGSAVSSPEEPPLTDTEFLTNVDDRNVGLDELERHFLNEAETPAMTRKRSDHPCDSAEDNSHERNERDVEQRAEHTEYETNWISTSTLVDASSTIVGAGSTLVDAGASVWTTLFTGLVALGAVSTAECKTSEHQYPVGVESYKQQYPVGVETYKIGRRCWSPTG